MMMIRPSQITDLKKMTSLSGAFLYSMWSGYRREPAQQELEEYLKNRGFTLTTAHVSGHADKSTLKKLIDTLCPKRLIPIHTGYPELFSELSQATYLAEDGEVIKCTE